MPRRPWPVPRRQGPFLFLLFTYLRSLKKSNRGIARKPYACSLIFIHKSYRRSEKGFSSTSVIRLPARPVAESTCHQRSATCRDACSDIASCPGSRTKGSS